jgi:2'-5' RNA ligase
MDGASKPLRLFFAVPVTDAVKSEAARRAAELSSSGADVSWTNPDSMHLTLRFLGATPPQRVPALERALDAAVRGRAPFSLEFDHLGFFGNPRAPKVLWAGVGAGLEPLKSLAEALWAALEAEGLPREERPFAAHLTLGRVRSSRRAAALVARVAERPAPEWSCPVDRLVLYSSKLSSAGSTHLSLSERRLGD